MEQQGGNGIEFEVGDASQGGAEQAGGEDLVIRKTFRVPLSGTDVLNAQINSKSYDLFNVSETGICIQLKTSDLFLVGDRLDNIKLTLDELSLNVAGIVMHVSPSEYGHYLCGIRLVEMTVTGQRKLKKFVKSNRRKLLG